MLEPVRRVVPFLPLLAIYIALAVISPGFAPEGDEAVYLRYAERITHGHYSDPAVSDADYLWYGPGLPLVLAPEAAVDLPIELIRLLGAAFLFGAVLVFDLLLRRVLRPAHALLGAYALGLYVPAWILLPHIYTEPLALLWLVVAMLFTSRALAPGGSRLDVALAGAAFGWLALTKVAFGWILTALLVGFGVAWLAQRARGRPSRTGRIAAIFCVALVVCVPWLAFTYSKTDRIFYWSNSGGLSLYWIASPYKGDLGAWTAIEDTTRPQHVRFFRSIDRLGPVEHDIALQRRARRWIEDDPPNYVRNVLVNTGRILFGAPYPDPSDQPLRPLLYGVPNALLLGALALCAPLLLRRRHELPPEALPFAAFAVVAFSFHLLLSADPRMLLPVVPPVLWLICVAVGRLPQSAVPAEPEPRPAVATVA
jgi:4-amino-4-deoxy-L-arabinose transferase-like glycosyltransferase